MHQFHRSFPGPPEIRESEISLIAEYYLEPSVGLYNYLRFNSDIEVFQESEAQSKSTRPPVTFSQVIYMCRIISVDYACMDNISTCLFELCFDDYFRGGEVGIWKSYFIASGMLFTRME